MPDGDNGVPSVQVKVFLSFVIPHVAGFSLDNVNVKERIYIEKVSFKLRIKNEE